MVVKLHHVEFLCNNIRKQMGQFCSGFGFKPFAEAFNPTRIALKRNSIYFVLKEDETHKDTVSNITFEVKNVSEVTKNIQNHGGEIISPPKISKDLDGHTISTIIQSPCGNVLHTLIDNSSYSGLFLPGFSPATTSTLDVRPNKFPGNSDEDLISHVDHIAFACHRGTSSQMIDWYSKCLGFKRFQVNPDEVDDGYTISSLVNGSFVGLKLSAMQYWKCSETGIEVNSDDSRNNVKFVFGEALPGQDAPNQIQTFLEEHGGPGVQHIGLHSTDMVSTIKTFKNNGVEFVSPPLEYYNQPSKIREICTAGHSIQSLRSQGILLDAESFTNKDENTTKKYLMQIFTKPLFEENTFFMEIIQRFGATGFGSGNITALWQALDEHLRKSQNRTKS